MDTDPKEVEVKANLKQGQQLKVVSAPKELKPMFYMVGTGIKRRGAQTDPVNFIKEIVSMSKPEQFVIKTIMEALTFDNKIGEVHIPTSMLNSSELQKWKLGMSKLKSKELVGSRKTSHFMINPNALIPQEYDKALEIWHKIYPHKVSPYKLDLQKIE